MENPPITRAGLRVPRFPTEDLILEQHGWNCTSCWKTTCTWIGVVQGSRYLWASSQCCLKPYPARDLRNVWCIPFSLENCPQSCPAFRISPGLSDWHNPKTRNMTEWNYSTLITPVTCALWRRRQHYTSKPEYRNVYNVGSDNSCEIIETLPLIYYLQNKLTEYKIRWKK